MDLIQSNRHQVMMKTPPKTPMTSLVIRRQKAQANQERVAVLAWLSKVFPQAFDTTEQVKPLAKGIYRSLIAALAQQENVPFSNSKLRETLAMFTHRMEYLVCLKYREPRVDLHGNEVGEVSEEEAQAAMVKIQQYVDKMSHSKHELPTLQAKAVSQHSPDSQLTSTAEQADTDAATKVTVKSKSKRRLDPEAIARLKEKLGIKQESA